MYRYVSRYKTKLVKNNPLLHFFLTAIQCKVTFKAQLFIIYGKYKLTAYVSMCYQVPRIK